MHYYFDGSIMDKQLKGAAKRLIFSLLVATMLSGCAIYEPAYPGYAPYQPYPYGSYAYPGGPYYVGPPVSLDLWFGSVSGGHRGGWGGGHRGGWGGRHR